MAIARALWETCDLRAKWDADRTLRARVRTKGSLVLRSGAVDSMKVDCTPVERTTANCRLNKYVLLPILNHMASVELKLPPIDFLLEQCQSFCEHECNATLPQTVIYQNAWGLRRLVRIVKSKLYRTQPPKDKGTK